MTGRPADSDLSDTAMAWRRTYTARWAAGLCVDCGTVPVPRSQFRCPACAARQLALFEVKP